MLQFSSSIRYSSRSHCCVLLMQRCTNVTYTGGCVNFTYPDSHSCTLITIFALSTGLRGHHPKSYTAKREVPLMTKELLYGIGLPVPLPQTVWMMPQMGVLCDGVCLVLQAPNRYNINQTTAISSLTTLIKDSFECIYVFHLQYMYNNIVPCMYPLLDRCL